MIVQKAKIDIRCSDEIKSEIKEAAWESRVSMSAWILRLVEMELQRTSVKGQKHGAKLAKKRE